MYPSYFVYPHSTQTVLQGAVERLLFIVQKEPNGEIKYSSPGVPELAPPLTPEKDVWMINNAYFMLEIRRIIGKLCPLSSEEAIERLPPDKKKRYQQALAEYRLTGLKKKHAKVTIFVKPEKMAAKDLGTACPRIIAFPGFVFGGQFARWILACKAPVLNAINRIYGGTVVMKGLNAVEVASAIVKAWHACENDGTSLPINMGDDNLVFCRDHNKEVHGLRIDASRWDQHNHEQTVIFKQWLLRLLFAGDVEYEHLLWLLEHQLNYDCEAVSRDQRTGIKYVLQILRCIGRMRSGDMDTDFAAIVIALCALHGFLRDYTPVPLNDLIAQLKEYFMRRGFKLKLEGLATCIEECEFCQSRPIFDGERWIMVRSLSAVIKDTYIICDKINLLERMAQIGTAGSIISAGIPIFEAFYRAMLRAGYTKKGVRKGTWNTNAWRDNGLAWLSGMGIPGMKKVQASQRAITEEARYSMYKAYNVTPVEQMAMEKDFDNVERGDAPGFKLILAGLHEYSPGLVDADVMGFSP